MTLWTNNKIKKLVILTINKFVSNICLTKITNSKHRQDNIIKFKNNNLILKKQG